MKGFKGATGAKGVVGFKGNKGLKGPVGPDGGPGKFKFNFVWNSLIQKIKQVQQEALETPQYLPKVEGWLNYFKYRSLMEYYEYRIQRKCRR